MIKSHAEAQSTQRQREKASAPLRESSGGDELPNGWATMPVAEVIEDFQPGFASGEKNVEGGVAHLRMNNIGLDGELVLDLLRTVPEKLAKPRHDLSPGDVLVCTTNSGALVGKCAYFDLPGRYAFSNHLTRLRPRRDIVDGRFLRWNLWLHWKRGLFNDKCKHWVNQSTLPKDALLEDEVVVPPVAEQRRIVAKLETLLGKVDASQQRLAKIPVLLKRFRQSVLAAACSGRLTADWREQNGVSEEFETTTVDAIAEYVGGFAYKSPTFLEAGKHQVIRIGNVRPFVLNLSASPVFIPDDIAADTERFKLKADDIVISMTGTKYKRDYGCAGIVRETDGSLFLNQRVARIRCGKSVLPKFLLFWLQTDLFRDFFFSGETGNVNQGNVGAGGIRNAPIELPPLPEQQEIVRRVEGLFALADQLEVRLAKARGQVDALTPSLLARAFAGKLVLQNPNDEPAEKLLERIKQQQR